MALDKGKIVSSALLMLGEVREYNNNNYELYIVATELIDEVTDEFSVSHFMKSNLDYRKLTLATENVDPEGRFIYNIPVDCYSIVRAVGNVPFEEIGERVHSYVEDLTVIINRKIPFLELKDIYFQIIKLKLCKKLAEVYPQFASKLEYIMGAIIEEELKLSILESTKHLSYTENSAFGRGF